MSAENHKSILITGGTGFIGRRLVELWSAAGHRITVITRNVSAAQKLLGKNVSFANSCDQLTDKYDWLVNLAGAGIADQRWSDQRKTEIRDSRIASTQALVRWATETKQHFSLVLSGSAVGFYGGLTGSQAEQTVVEDSPVGDDFSAHLCSDWEQAAAGFEQCSDRVVFLRTGLVLGPRGGMLKRMWLPFSMGAGGKIGSGTQYMPWIHMKDYVSAIQFLVEHPLQGAINMTAPSPVTNQEFTLTLANALKRPAFMPMPSLVAKVAFGEMSELLLRGQRALPKKLLDQGFQFQYTELTPALSEIANTW